MKVEFLPLLLVFTCVCVFANAIYSQTFKLNNHKDLQPLSSLLWFYNLPALGYGFTTYLELMLVADAPERSVNRLEA